MATDLSKAVSTLARVLQIDENSPAADTVPATAVCPQCSKEVGIRPRYTMPVNGVKRVGSQVFGACKHVWVPAPPASPVQ